MPKASWNRAVRSKNLVGFSVDGVPYAIDIQRVREIIKPLPTLPIPHAPEAVIGVADHRGDVVPVIDLRVRFVGVSAKASDRDQIWIVVKRADRYAGLVVDRVTEVFGAAASQYREVPDIGLGDWSQGIISVCTHRGNLVFVLDVDRITDLAEHIDLSALKSIQPHEVSNDGK
jgi:purine-binding chemotaxis protein CheW